MRADAQTRRVPIKKICNLSSSGIRRRTHRRKRRALGPENGQRNRCPDAETKHPRQNQTVQRAGGRQIRGIAAKIALSGRRHASVSQGSPAPVLGFILRGRSPGSRFSVQPAFPTARAISGILGWPTTYSCGDSLGFAPLWVQLTEFPFKPQPLASRHRAP